MPKDRYLSELQFTIIGRRYGSEDVAKEASEAAARWQRDLASLSGYGHGQTALDAFKKLLAQHSGLLSGRPEAVADKKNAFLARDTQVMKGWAWLSRVEATLGMLGREDQAVSTALAAALPEDDAGLATGIRALATLLADNKTRIPPESDVDKRLGEVDALCAALQASPGVVHTARGQTVADTVQIDLYDGKIYTYISDLNRAARSAIRNGDLHASLSEYTFHHLKRGRNGSSAEPVPAPVNGTQPTNGAPGIT